MHADTGEALADNVGSREAPPEIAPELGTVPLSAIHRVNEFVCPKSPRVEAFLRGDCQEYLKCNYCRVFVWPDPNDPGRVLGYYSLSACIVQRAVLSGSVQKKTPGGVGAPVILIGFMGKTVGAPDDFGPVLIYDAALRVSRITDIGIWGIALNPENETLAKWYEKKADFRRAKMPDDEVPLMYARLDWLLDLKK